MSNNSNNIINYEMMDKLSLNKIIEIMKYLEKKWTIKKNNNHYILKKENNIKFILTSNYSCNEKIYNDNLLEKQSCIYIFIYNTLENGWTIKKNKSKFILKKKHQGKKEFFSKNYLNEFIVENIYKK